MYTLLVKDGNNEIFPIAFDPHSRTLVNKKTFQIIKRKSIGSFERPSPYVLSVVLGVKCNLHCDYCIQTDIRSRVNLDFSPKKVKGFLNKLKKVDLTKIRKINLWGGEPLVYWKTLQLLIPELKAICPNLERFYLSTNGALLTEDKLDFLLQNNTTIQISDDIFNENRNINLEKTRELLSKMKEKYPDSNMCIHACYTKEHPDALKTMQEAEKWYKGSFDFRGSPVGPPLHLGNSPIKYELPFTKDALLLMEESIFQAYIKKEKFAYLDRKIFQFFKASHLKGYACRFATQQEVCLDVHGNMYACRGSFDPENIIGNVEVDNVPVISPKFKKVTDRAFCKNCPLIFFCNGICSQLPDRVISKYCLTHYASSRGVFRAMLKLVYNLDLIKILNIDADKIFQHCLSYEELSNKYNASNKPSKIIPITLES